MSNMNESTLRIVENSFCNSVFIVMVLAKTIFDGDGTNTEICVRESADEIITNLGDLADLADKGNSDARTILDHIREFVVKELVDGTYILSDEPTIDRVLEYTGNMMEQLTIATDAIQNIFLSAIKEATVKLGITVDVSIKDADARWILSSEDAPGVLGTVN
jgi:hypothetical protein